MLSSIRDPKIIAFIIVVVFTTNILTFFVARSSNDDCSAVREKMERDEAELKRAMGIPTNLNPNREGGLKITDDIR